MAWQKEPISTTGAKAACVGGLGRIPPVHLDPAATLAHSKGHRAVTAEEMQALTSGAPMQAEVHVHMETGLSGAHCLSPELPCLKGTSKLRKEGQAWRRVGSPRTPILRRLHGEEDSGQVRTMGWI